MNNFEKTPRGNTAWMNRFLTALLLLVASVAAADDLYHNTRVTDWPDSYPVSGTVQLAVSPMRVFKNVSLSTVPAHVTSASCALWGWTLYNNAVAGNERSVKFFNVVSTPVAGVTVPDMTITVGGRSPSTLVLPSQITFQNGLWILATTSSGDAAAIAPAAGEVSSTVFFK